MDTPFPRSSVCNSGTTCTPVRMDVHELVRVYKLAVHTRALGWDRARPGLRQSTQSDSTYCTPHNTIKKKNTNANKALAKAVIHK